jgi:uncharacterized membrane protein
MIGRGKTKSHSIEQFQRLVSEIEETDGHISLPNVLSEASNHLGSGMQQAIPNAAEFLGRFIVNLEETYRPSREVVAIAEYMSVCLTDAAILSCAPRLVSERVRVFTQDHQLYRRLCDYNVDCVNITHWLTPKR